MNKNDISCQSTFLTFSFYSSNVPLKGLIFYVAICPLVQHDLILIKFLNMVKYEMVLRSSIFHWATAWYPANTVCHNSTPSWEPDDYQRGMVSWPLVVQGFAVRTVPIHV